MTDEQNKKPTRRAFLIAAAAGVGALVVGKKGAEKLEETIADPDFQARNFYKPAHDIAGNPLPPIEDPSHYGLSGIKAVTLTTPEGYEFLTWQSEELRPGKKTLVLFPGNCGHLGHAPDEESMTGIKSPSDWYAQVIKAAMDKGYQIVATNYVGFAGSNTTPSQEKIYAGAEHLMNTLTNEHKIGPKDLCIFGMSFGSPVAVHATNHVVQNSRAFHGNSGQNINCLLSSGMTDVGVGIDAMIPWDWASGKINSVWHEKYDVRPDYAAMNNLPSTVKERIHINFMRGTQDTLTPESQMEAHKQLSPGDFSGVTMPGGHFLPADKVVKMLDEMHMSSQTYKTR